MKLQNNKKIYFSSDNHLGAPNNEESRLREKKFISWLEHVRKDAQAIYLLGDLFDFWFEYKTVVPKGFVRILGKLAEFQENGIQVHYFVGNHDLWMKDYFESELGITVYHKPKEFTIESTCFFIGHGDGLGPKDVGYKRMKKLFTNSLAKRLFQALHPDWGVRLGKYFSIKNKLISGAEDISFMGKEEEWLAIYAKRKLELKHYDYFLFGHRHLPMEISLNETSKYINLGDWITHYTYGEFDGKTVFLKKWETP